MTNEEQQHPDEQQPILPSKKDKLRPLELLGLAAVFTGFATMVVLLATRDVQLTLIVAGIAFISALIVLSLIGLSIKPNPEDLEARKDLDWP